MGVLMSVCACVDLCMGDFDCQCMCVSVCVCDCMGMRALLLREGDTIESFRC